MRAGKKFGVALAAAVLALSACTSSNSDSTPTGEFQLPVIAALSELGDTEGQLNLLARAGYVENGATDPRVNWVAPFEKQTGCKVTVTVPESTEQLLELVGSGPYDAAAVPGEVSQQLVYDGAVAPLNSSLVPNYADVVPGLKNQPWNSFAGKTYGIPHGRSANVLMWRTDIVKTAPTSWAPMYQATFAGKIAVEDSPLSIADTAVYAMKAKPELGITNPYALDKAQLAGVLELLRVQKPNVGLYWTDYAAQADAFKSGAAVIGAAWQATATLAAAEKVPAKSAIPTEGTTGWSDSWMVTAQAKNPNCAYAWMNYIVSPAVNAQAAEWFGMAPANSKSCALTSDKKFCTSFRATDDAYFKNVWMSRAPLKQCVDGRDAVCTDYAEWAKAWADLRAS